MSSNPPPPLSPRPRRGPADFAALLESWDSPQPDLELSSSGQGAAQHNDDSSASREREQRIAAAIRSAATSPARSTISLQSRGRSRSPALSTRSVRSARSAGHTRTMSEVRDEREVERSLGAQATPGRPITPEIRTTLPSPRRPEPQSVSRGRQSPSAGSDHSGADSVRSAGSRASFASGRGRATIQGESGLDAIRH